MQRANLEASGYLAMTVLADGSVFTIGGSWSGGRGNKHREVWSSSAGTWRLLDNVKADAFQTSDIEGVLRSGRPLAKTPLDVDH